jgi:hypothetical protein
MRKLILILALASCACITHARPKPTTETPQTCTYDRTAWDSPCAMK